jgi:hypothetical protein
MTTPEPTPTPPEFAEGAVKQDPETKAVAVRTNFPDPYYDHQWGVMTVDRGGHYASFDDVESWPDLSAPVVREEEKANDRQ